VDTRVGSRSAFIVPLRAGNRARRDPKEEREAPRGENHWREKREGTMNPANLSTKRQWIAGLARRSSLSEWWRASFATQPSAKLSCEEPDAGNLHVRVCGGGGWQAPHLPGRPAALRLGTSAAG